MPNSQEKQIFEENPHCEEKHHIEPNRKTDAM